MKTCVEKNRAATKAVESKLSVLVWCRVERTIRQHRPEEDSNLDRASKGNNRQNVAATRHQLVSGSTSHTRRHHRHRTTQAHNQAHTDLQSDITDTEPFKQLGQPGKFESQILGCSGPNRFVEAWLPSSKAETGEEYIT